MSTQSLSLQPAAAVQRPSLPSRALHFLWLTGLTLRRRTSRRSCRRLPVRPLPLLAIARQFVLALLIGALFIVLGPGCAKRPDPRNRAGPPNEFRDLGAFLRDEVSQLACDFVVRNSGQSVVKFSDKRTSCGCAKADLGSTVLKPGEQTTLHLEADLRGIASDQVNEKEIHCELVTEAGPVWRYRFRAIVYPTIAFEPREHFFGQIDPFTPAQGQVSLVTYRREKEDAPEISDIRPTSESLTVLPAEPEPPVVMAGGIVRQRTLLHLALQPQQRAGYGRAEIAVKCNGAAAENELSLATTWAVKSLYRVQPPRLFFDGREENRQREIRIARSDKKPFRLLDVKSPHASVEVQADSEHAAEHVVTVRFLGEPTPQVLAGELTIETDHALQQRVAVPVSILKTSTTAEVRSVSGGS